MIIVLEGPDNCGKSTLAKNLQSRLEGSAIIHASGDEKFHSCMQEYHQHILDTCAMNPRIDWILDRHWPSEYAYSPYSSPETRDLSYSYSHFIELMRDALYVFCIAPLHTILEDESLDKDLMTKVHARYNDLLMDMHNTGASFISLSRDVLSPYLMVEIVLKQMARVKEKARIRGQH